MFCDTGVTGQWNSRLTLLQQRQKHAGKASQANEYVTVIAQSNWFLIRKLTHSDKMDAWANVFTIIGTVDRSRGFDKQLRGVVHGTNNGWWMERPNVRLYLLTMNGRQCVRQLMTHFRINENAAGIINRVRNRMFKKKKSFQKHWATSKKLFGRNWHRQHEINSFLTTRQTKSFT